MSSELLAPRSLDELAAAVRAAASERQRLTPWGAGTLQHLGGAPAPEAMQLHTGALNRIVEYNPADLTITAEAGAPLGMIQAALREHGQWLPWDPPAPEAATLGGLLAAGTSGPLRLGYGTPRDWALGMRVVLGDGRLVKSGGKVVKNVAGYDTHKLQIGALGTLGVIAEATLKVAPLPEHVETLVFACPARDLALAMAEQLRTRPLAPASLVLSEGESPPQALLAVRFAGPAAAVARQARLAEAAAHALGAAPRPLDDASRALIWPALAGFANPGLHHQHASGAALIIRAGAPPAALGALLDALERAAPPGGSAYLQGYAGVGLAYARWYAGEVREETILRAVAALRARLAGLGGYAVIEHAPAALRARIDVWDEPPATIGLMRGLKAQWDPQNILNRGRYVAGI